MAIEPTYLTGAILGTIIGIFIFLGFKFIAGLGWVMQVFSLLPAVPLLAFQTVPGWAVCLVFTPLQFRVYRSYGSLGWLVASIAILGLGMFFGQDSHLKPWLNLLVLGPIILIPMFLTINRERHIANTSKKSNIAFKNLIRVACHDISNPLTLILGASQIAESGALDQRPEKIKELWSKIIRSSEKINRCLINLRSYESIQPPARLTIDSIKTEALLNELKGSFFEAAQQAKVSVEYSIQPTHGEFQGDYLLLKQACFSCLIENAIRYANEGSVINVDLTLGSDEFRFLVSNEGDKILQEISENLFQFDFVERPISPKGSKEGGFSLSICKLVAEHFGGTFSLTQSQNNGNSLITKAEVIIPF